MLQKKRRMHTFVASSLKGFTFIDYCLERAGESIAIFETTNQSIL